MIIFVFEEILARWFSVLRTHNTIVKVPHILDGLWAAELDEDETHNTDNDDGEGECVYGLECESVTHMLVFFGWFVFKWGLVWVIIFIYLLLFSGG